ncbi:unnamed protein product [Colias eurytheme]|nr:unnamed protein product [Colias eurytheme]
MKPLLSRTTDVKTEEDFIRIDVPLVNITGNLGLDEISSHRRLDTDELFDLIYDVTPRPYYSRLSTPTTKSYETFTPLPTIQENVLSIIYNNSAVKSGKSWEFIEDLMESFNFTAASQIITENATNPFSKSDPSTLLTHTYSSIPTEYSVSTEHESGSLVNHKSFENVVQAAPDIAVLLNKYNVESLPKQKDNVTSHVRKKRYIKALEIENARPRNLTTLKSMTRTTEKVYRYSDMQDLAQLVELEDDEIQGRVALRYLRKYVGSALFNICDYNEPKARQVYLFNSSRIVIAISNFTMDRMTLVVTPASTLMSSVGRCPPAHLECQVAGTRVCIDATNECDGVPNCGAYDIYDEDRLRCGWSLGLQHNVCLAACTFLAVILTILYTIHYWLKRCVPRVSEAFFVYSDTSENTLYLDSIMRSPNDNTDDYSKLFYQANIFDDDEEFMKMNTKTSRCSRLKSFLLSCILFKKKTIAKECIDDPAAHEMLNMPSIPRKIYSFTEYELRDITPVIKDAMVQTGSSLEIRDTGNRNENYQTRTRNKASISSDLDQAFSDNSNELNILKLIRNLKISPKPSDESQSNLFVNKKEDYASHKIHVTEEEKELHSTLYEPSTSVAKKQKIQKTTVAEVHPIKPKPVLSKHLRFDEDITTIPSPGYEDDDSESHQSVVGVGSSRHLTTIEEVDEHVSSSNDFMRFWRSGKNKKSQKKSHLSLR